MSSGEKKVCVVGAGVSGLVTIKECLQGGIVPTCYELGADIGGTWDQKPDPLTSTTPMVWDRLVTNTPKYCTLFSDLPPSQRQTPYLQRKEMKNYLDRYADHFQLRPHITLKTEVVKVRKCSDFLMSGQWEVFSRPVTDVWDKGLDNMPVGGHLLSCKKEIFDVVMVCSGYFRHPSYPSIKGMDTFKGETLHSYHYKDSKSMEGKRVLVVGNSLSATDVAEDIARNAEKVLFSMGRGGWIMPRITTGGFTLLESHSRSQIYSSRVEAIFDLVTMNECNNRIDHDKTGIRPNNLPRNSPLSVGEHIQIHIMTGRVEIFGHLEALTSDSAQLSNHPVLEPVDVVVYCTGFKPDLAFVEDDILQENGRLDLYQMMFPLQRQHSTLIFVGQCGIDIAFLPLAELQARLAVKVVNNDCKLPSQKNMKESVDTINSINFARRANYSYYLPGYLLVDVLAQVLGVYPSFWKIFFRDPKLAFRIWYGPVYNAQFRLLGPGSNWETARKLCHQAYEERGYCYTSKSVQPLPPVESMCARVPKCFCAALVLAGVVTVAVYKFKPIQ